MIPSKLFAVHSPWFELQLFRIPLLAEHVPPLEVIYLYSKPIIVCLPSPLQHVGCIKILQTVVDSPLKRYDGDDDDVVDDEKTNKHHQHMMQQ